MRNAPVNHKNNDAKGLVALNLINEERVEGTLLGLHGQ